MFPGRPRLCRTRDLKYQNEYTKALLEDLAEYAFSEEKAPQFKGHWQTLVFKNSSSACLDLEIGTGNGTHFADLALKAPHRNLVGIEVKYKPLIQTIRRVLRGESQNARVIRYDAFLLEDLFAPQELDDVYIHFPDPWTSPRKPKNRILQRAVLELLAQLQKPTGRVFFKTDSLEYFEWALEEIKFSKYQVVFKTYDLHKSEKAVTNFVTQFENIFIRKGQPIYAVDLAR